MEIAIIGLGYVGLPLAVAFAKKYRVRGFDIDSSRIADLQQGVDNTLEVDENELVKVLKTSVDNSGGLTVSSDPASIQFCSVYIVTVPTPITRFKSPDLSPLLSATAMIGGMLKKGDVVVYESTVYPGCTEEDCVPVLEQTSGLRYNLDFFCGYSPERVNPGDKKNRLETIRKVVSGSTPEVAGMLTGLYASIIEAGVFTASSMKVAEASKAIENAQRDVNISFVNEYNKALEYKDDYVVTLILNMNDMPTFLTIENPIKNLKFEEKIITSRISKEYHLVEEIC